MSMIGNRHNVVPYVAGTESPDGVQLLVAKWNKTTQNPNPASPVMASVPALVSGDLTDAHIGALRDWITDRLSETREEIFKSLYMGSDYSLGVVTDDDISIARCINFLTAQRAASVRVSAEEVGKWYDAFCGENVTIFALEKLAARAGLAEPTHEMWNTAQAIAKGQRSTMTDLCARDGVKKLTPAQVDMCRKTIALASAGGESFGARLQELKIDAPLRAPAPAAQKSIDMSALMD